MASTNHRSELHLRPSNNSKLSSARNLVLVSGYYGYGNLGDEAILEQIITELKSLVPESNILVLSANPGQTSLVFGVRAISRWNIIQLACILTRTRLFISGGGGLFQDTRSPGSCAFYGFQILLARLLGARVMIYAQGIGPLQTTIGRLLTVNSMRAAQSVCVRDAASLSLLAGWAVEATQTADPVWCLEPTALPASMSDLLRQLACHKASGKQLIGLSLRPSINFTPAHFDWLERSLQATLPEGATILMLPLQKDHDQPLLMDMACRLKSLGFETLMIDGQQLERPSQWISLIKHCDFLIAMRLHALIMALKSELPVVGIAYDPKVQQLLTSFEQPMLILTKEIGEKDWVNTLRTAFSGIKQLSAAAAKHAQPAKKLACQNFNLLARILSIQSAP